MENELLKQIK